MTLTNLLISLLGLIRFSAFAGEMMSQVATRISRVRPTTDQELREAQVFIRILARLTPAWRKGWVLRELNARQYEAPNNNHWYIEWQGLIAYFKRQWQQEHPGFSTDDNL